jgi:type II secretory pathway pseudopilin PulG
VVARNRLGFTLFELIALVAMMAVAALITCLSLGPLEARAEKRVIEATAGELNELAAKYQSDRGYWPIRNGGVWDLAVAGYLDYRSEPDRYYFYFKNFAWDEQEKRFRGRSEPLSQN